MTQPVAGWEARLVDARQRGDPALRAALIEEFMPLAGTLARRFYRSNDAQEDLAQVAYVGLVKAVDRFDPERGARFPSFAVPTILGELRLHLRDRTWRVHVPRRLQELILALGPVTEALSAQFQRAPTVAELATALLVSPEEVLNAWEASNSQFGRSFDEPAHRGGRHSLAETLGSEDRALATTDQAVVLNGWLARLPVRQREVVRLRFVEDLTQCEIAGRTGISQMHVSRLLRRSIEDLRAMSTLEECG